MSITCTRLFLLLFLIFFTQEPLDQISLNFACAILHAQGVFEANCQDMFILLCNYSTTTNPVVKGVSQLH